MSGYGEVVRETAAQAHERKVEAIEAVLKKWGLSEVDEDGWSICIHLEPAARRRLAQTCLAAVEAGF
jgi:hypothetical protein